MAALADELYMPLVVHMVREYGMVPCSIDSHIGEYLPFTADVADWYPARVDVMEGTSAFGERVATWVARTKVPVPFLHRDRPQLRGGHPADHRHCGPASRAT